MVERTSSQKTIRVRLQRREGRIIGNEDFEEALYQYGILIRKLLDAGKELDEVHESLRVERVYTYTSIDKRIWSEIHDKIAQITEVNEELNKLLHYILGINENL